MPYGVGGTAEGPVVYIFLQMCSTFSQFKGFKLGEMVSPLYLWKVPIRCF